MKRSLNKLLGFGLIAAMGIFSAQSCKKKSSSSDTSGDSTQTTTISDNTKSLTLTIDSGTMNGASILVPAGSLPQDASLTIAAADQPADFNTVTSGNASASGTLQLSIADANGKTINATLPLTLSLPYSPAASPSASVSTSVGNLLALLKTADGKLYYWLNAEFVEIDQKSNLASLAVLDGGYYTLAYAAQSAPTGFQDAPASGVAGMTPASIDYSTVQCPSGTTNIYSQIQGLSNFPAFVNAYINCYCNKANIQGAQCVSAVQAQMAAPLCSSNSTSTITNDQLDAGVIAVQNVCKS